MADYDPDQMAHAEAISRLQDGIDRGEIPEKYTAAVDRLREELGERLKDALADIPPEKRAGKYRPRTEHTEQGGGE